MPPRIAPVFFLAKVPKCHDGRLVTVLLLKLLVPSGNSSSFILCGVGVGVIVGVGVCVGGTGVRVNVGVAVGGMGVGVIVYGGGGVGVRLGMGVGIPTCAPITTPALLMPISRITPRRMTTPPNV